MSRSDKRIEEERKAVADAWNAAIPTSVDDPRNLIAGAIHDTLMWARGRRVQSPLKTLEMRWKWLAQDKARAASDPQEGK